MLLTQTCDIRLRCSWWTTARWPCLYVYFGTRPIKEMDTLGMHEMHTSVVC